jgi:Glycosyl transferase family 2
MNSTVAVITPTKNRLKLLCETMDSVARQSFDAWEHIIVDDGSDDGTSEEVTKRAAADSRIRYIRRTGKRSGANVCRNIGIAKSTVDFATFQAGVFEDTVGDVRSELDPQLLGDHLLRFLFFECPWIITGPIWRRASLLLLGLFDESLPSWQDIDLHVRAIAKGFRYLRFPEVDHHVRWQFEPTKVSVEQRRSPRHLGAATEILEKFERLVREGPGMDWVRQRALCSLYFFVAEQWVATGNLSFALQSWRGIRERALGSRVLYASGAVLLIMLALGFPGRRLCDRTISSWKGWMRLRTNPRLLRT